MEDLVTIVVPIYNVEKYLKKCVETIINQTYNNIEIILVNDGSTDNSLQICNEFQINYIIWQKKWLLHQMYYTIIDKYKQV